jgi:NIPSNAP
MLALIESYTDIVFELDEVTVQEVPMNHFVEIRSYNLKLGTREEFHRLFLEEAFPMLQRWKVDVVAYGPSLHDQDSYFLMRRFDSLAQREESENAFYGSDEWRQGPREAIIALIESYTEIVLELDEATIRGLRRIQP